EDASIVAGDHIAPADRAADGVVVATDDDAVAVGQRRAARLVDPDEVVEHEVVCTGDDHGAAVPRDHVLSRGQRADHVRVALDPDAHAVRDSAGTRGVRTDVVHEQLVASARLQTDTGVPDAVHDPAL